ncbi:MAG: hypothetical protein WD176_01915, partial [Pirellulales bacterium]
MMGRYGETLVVDWGLAKALGKTPPQSSDKNAAPASPSDGEPAALPESPLVPSTHGSAEATQLGAALGTPAYMSPEQAQGRIDLLSPASDVFSLGATLYHILTGRPPHVGKDSHEILQQALKCEFPRPRALQPGIPRSLEAVCLRALSPQREQRYATATELACEVERHLADEPVRALPEDVWTSLGRWSRRNRHWMQAASVALLLVATTAIAAYFYQRETAAQNLTLAEEKGKLAEEKGKLASEKSELAENNLKLAQDAEAKAASLRAALAQNLFAHGVSEYAAGRPHSGIVDLQRAWSLSAENDPLQPHYLNVLLDHAQHGRRALVPPLWHEEGVIVVAFSPQGDRVLTGSQDNTARLWDARTGAAVGEPMRHESYVESVAFSPQGDRVLTGS